MKKFFKNFWTKYKGFIIVVVLFGLFVLLSILTEEGTKKDSKSEIDLDSLSEEVLAWVNETESDKTIVTVIAQTTCGHCINYKPVIEALKAEYGFDLYWWEIDEIYNAGKTEDYNAITSYYPLKSYEGTPHTYITKSGELVKEKGGAITDSETLKEFLKANGVIE